MRRFLTAAAVLAVLAAGGCSGSGGSGVVPGVPSTSAAAAGTDTTDTTDTAGGPETRSAGNTAEVCATARKAGTDAVSVFVTQLAKMLQANADNDTRAAEAARDSATAALRTWGDALTGQAGKATDPDLTRVLTQMSGEVGRLSADVADLDDSRFDQLSDALATICG